MISKLLDKLESRIQYLETIIGPWNSQLENQETILTSLDFLEKSTKLIYMDIFHVNEHFFQSLDAIVCSNMSTLEVEDFQKRLHCSISLYYKDMKILDEKLKQLDDVYYNGFLKNVERFNDLPLNQLLKISSFTKNYNKLRQLVITQNHLIVRTLNLIRKFIEKSLVSID